MKTEFDTKNYLKSKRAQGYTINEQDFSIIDRLCKKVDVVQRIYQKYYADITIPKIRYEVSPEYYSDFFKLLSSAVVYFNDYKFINTALKLNDLLLKRKLIDRSTAEKNKNKLIDFINFQLNDSKK